MQLLEGCALGCFEYVFVDIACGELYVGEYGSNVEGVPKRALGFLYTSSPIQSTN
jgi:hypothetical protein